LDGYGIRYNYGLFRQKIEDSMQSEYPDDWETFPDFFGVKKAEEKVRIDFSDMTVYAVPYDYFVPGYKNEKVNRLRLYDCESEEKVSFKAFENCDTAKAFEKENDAKAITAFLYPNDSTEEGKKLRLRQQYFFTSAALQNILSEIYDEKHFEDLPNRIAIQLNDTHPTVAIAEFIRLIMKKGKSFDFAFSAAQKIFSYTNHTVMSEALEKWDAEMFSALLPEVFDVIEKLNLKLIADLKKKTERLEDCLIVKDGLVHMANLACYVCSHINGVAKIHSDIIAKNTLSQWHELFPSRFSNKTNGITERRWLALANEELYNYVCSLVKADVAIDVEAIEKLREFENDEKVLEKLFEIRQRNKEKLCEYIRKNDGVSLEKESVFFIQIKRIHEYKRQLLGALCCLYLYEKIKRGELSSLPKISFVFAGKAASGYKEAKLSIEFIVRLSKIINADNSIEGRLKVAFVSDYNVSKAEKLIPAADYSLQLSLAGTEASGTGNMKFMLNGAPTVGTFDGANIEIVNLAGEENNYIFGLREEEVSRAKEFYDPKEIYESSDIVKETLDFLSEEPFCSEECFSKIQKLLLENDRYMVLADFESFVQTVVAAAEDYKDKKAYFKKALINTASSAFFSSDRTVKEYANEIWNV
ncbi:MAG: glycogen/starch/alpha-glucan family phosphorylase, partial [Clostridia bacterium]|nr:glycogen/starch/alpha-glucan family phosphorylase [Clostridia bacterium]